jgi:hypothetical protein
MHAAIRPYVISGIAIASAGILVALPATTPELTAPPDVRIVAHAEAPTTNALLAANLSAAQPSITAVPDLSPALITDSAEELLGAVAIIAEATGVAIEEVVRALGNVPSIFQGALEDLASGESPVDVLRDVGVRININIRNMFVFPLRTLQGLPAPFGGAGGVFDQLEEFVIAVSNAIMGFISPPLQGIMSASQANLPLSAPDTADVTVAQEATTGIVEDGDLATGDAAGAQRRAEPTGDALGNSGEAVAGQLDADPVTTDDAGEAEPAAAPVSTLEDTEKANGATDLSDGNMSQPGTGGTDVDGRGSTGPDSGANADAVNGGTNASGSDTESTDTSDGEPSA